MSLPFLYNQTYNNFYIQFDVPLTINTNFYQFDKNIEYNIEIDKSSPQIYTFEDKGVLKYTLELQMVNQQHTSNLFNEYRTQSKHSLYTLVDHKGVVHINLEMINLTIKPQKVNKLAQIYYNITIEMVRNNNE